MTIQAYGVSHHRLVPREGANPRYCKDPHQKMCDLWLRGLGDLFPALGKVVRDKFGPKKGPSLRLEAPRTR